jgi:hypothetical protein
MLPFPQSTKTTGRVRWLLAIYTEQVPDDVTAVFTATIPASLTRLVLKTSHHVDVQEDDLAHNFRKHELALSKAQKAFGYVTRVFAFSVKWPKMTVSHKANISSIIIIRTETMLSGRTVECLKMEERHVKHVTG